MENPGEENKLEQEAYKKAKKRVDAKLDFFNHLLVYAGVMVFLFIINLLTSPGYYWVKWPALGWGIFVFLNGVKVFFSDKTSAMRERMIEEEMKKELSRKG